MVETVNSSLKICHITPKPEDLLGQKTINCTEPNCSATFTHKGNLQMHLTKHHKKFNHLGSENNKDEIKIYFCPEEGCDYNKNHPSNRHFLYLKYVRQHYQKVHAEKKFKCEKCDKNFLTEGILANHNINCGRKYICDECGWNYNSREALLTHIKRKNHKTNLENTKNFISHIKELQPNVEFIKNEEKPVHILVEIVSEMKDQAVQTEESVSTKKKVVKRKSTQKLSNKNTKHVKTIESETAMQNDQQAGPVETQHSIEATNKNDKSHLNIDIYDQNEPSPDTDKEDNLNSLSYNDDTNSCFNQLVNSSSLCDIETQTEFSTSMLDQMLYSNMHTQTCDDFLSELGLTDIQTQTNWSSISEHHVGTSVAHDELLVSTETQTSFTQCLLECNNGSSSSTMGITQHTQTCEELLEGLFGSQESDLIGGYQSTHTQT